MNATHLFVWTDHRAPSILFFQRPAFLLVRWAMGIFKLAAPADDKSETTYPTFSPQSCKLSHPYKPASFKFLTLTISLARDHIFLEHLPFFKSRLYNYQLLWLRQRTLLQPLRSTTLSSALISTKLCVLILTITKCPLSTC